MTVTSLLRRDGVTVTSLSNAWSDGDVTLRRGMTMPSLSGVE